MEWQTFAMTCRTPFLALASATAFAALAVLPQAGAAALAPSYFLSQDGYLTPAKDQGSLGTCWAFSANSMLESAMLRQGIVASPASPLLDLSEWHLATANGNITVLTATYDPVADDWDYDGWGGFPEYATGYWTRGRGEWLLEPSAGTTPAGGGPVLEVTNPLNAYPFDAIDRYENLTPYVAPAKQAILPIGIKQSIYFDWDGNLATFAAYQESLKEAIGSYGALASAVFTAPNFSKSVAQTGGIFGTGNEDPSHAVTLVGWDDTKVLTIDGIEYTGAWLIQNSWGDHWGVADPYSGERGYFWLPYADTSPANAKLATAVTPRGPHHADGIHVYSPVVLQNQIFAPFKEDEAVDDVTLHVTGFAAGTQTLSAQKLTAHADGPREVTLAAIGLWQAEPGTTVTITLYGGWGEEGPLGTPLAVSTTHTMVDEGTHGYNEIDLDAPVTFGLGESVYVVVDYGDGYDHPITLDVRTPLALLGRPDLSGLSWMSDGDGWDDLFTSLEVPGVQFLKGITIFEELPEDGSVTGLKQTLTFAEVPQLTFGEDSELFLNGPLEVTSGSISLPSGTAWLRGDGFSTPGDLTYTGPGLLIIGSDAEVGGSAHIQSGLVALGGRFEAEHLRVGPSATAIVEASGHLVLTATSTTSLVPTGGLVISEGWISGNGVIAASLVNNGTIAPGHSPGTLTVAGDYTQSGTYQWEAASKNDYDRLVVTGTATLGGTLELVPYKAGAFQYGRKFRNIVSAARVEGQFRTVTAPEGFRGRLLQKKTSLDLLLAPESYTLVAANRNQHNLARVLDRYIPATRGDRETVSLALDHLSAEEYSAAFEAILPGFYQTAAGIGITLATSQTQLLAQRLGTVRFGSGGLSLQGVEGAPTYTGSGSREILATPAAPSRWSVWAQGSGLFGRSRSVADLPSHRYDSGGFLIGGDHRWSPALSTGLFGGYQGVEARYDYNGRVRGNGGTLGLYAVWDQGAGFHATGLLSASLANYETRRPIRFGSIDRTARGDFDAWTGTAFLESGYRFEAGGFQFGPIANLQYSRLRADGFTETNAASLNLALGTRTTESLQSNLGARVALPWKVSESVLLLPELRAFWNHEFLQSPQDYTARLDGGQSASFAYRTSAPARDSMQAGGGLTARFGPRWSASAYYQAGFGNGDVVNHNVSASVGVEF